MVVTSLSLVIVFWLAELTSVFVSVSRYWTQLFEERCACDFDIVLAEIELS